MSFLLWTHPKGRLMMMMLWTTHAIERLVMLWIHAIGRLVMLWTHAVRRLVML